MDELLTIPGVGKSIARDLRNIGIRYVADLRGKIPEELYDLSNRFAGLTQDRCLLYTFRCAVYFAETEHPDPNLLKWWNWKDKPHQAAGRRRWSKNAATFADTLEPTGRRSE